MRHVSARSSAEIPVVTLSSLESIVIVYAVHFGSAFSVTIWGRARRVARSGVMGAQIKPLRIVSVLYWELGAHSLERVVAGDAELEFALSAFRHLGGALTSCSGPGRPFGPL